MAHGTNGNGQNNGSGQSNGLLFDLSSAHTFSLLEAVMTETLGMSMHNAVRAQNSMQMVSGAAVVAACARMLQASPPPPPLPPPVPPPVVGPASGTASVIAKDTVRADTAISALAQDYQTSSANVSSATAALQALAKQAQAAMSPPPPPTPPTPAPPTPPASGPSLASPPDLRENRGSSEAI
jgi:hypothetical protein